MRSRSGYNNGNKKWDKYPTSGYTNVEIDGYVQKIKQDEKHQCDYVTFYIVDENDPVKNGQKRASYEIIGVTVPWDLDIELDEGDHVKIWGIIKSWSTDYGIKLEIRAQVIEDQTKTPFN